MTAFRRAAAAGLTGLTLTAATVAYAGGARSDATPAQPERRPYEPSQSVDGLQARRFGVLRRPRRTDDALPPMAARAVEKGPAPDLGASPGLSRRAAPGGTELYVVPGRGWLCLATADGVASCNTTEKAVAGLLIGLSGLPGDGLTLQGLVPDGVEIVEVLGAGGERLAAAVADNAWSARPPFTPELVHWAGPASSADVPVFVPPPAETAPEPDAAG